MRLYELDGIDLVSRFRQVRDDTSARRKLRRKLSLHSPNLRNLRKHPNWMRQNLRNLRGVYKTPGFGCPIGWMEGVVLLLLIHGLAAGQLD